MKRVKTIQESSNEEIIEVLGIIDSNFIGKSCAVITFSNISSHQTTTAAKFVELSRVRKEQVRGYIELIDIGANNSSTADIGVFDSFKYNPHNNELTIKLSPDSYVVIKQSR